MNEYILRDVFGAGWSAAGSGVRDYSKVDSLGPWYKSVNVGVETSCRQCPAECIRSRRVASPGLTECLGQVVRKLTIFKGELTY